MGWDGSEPASSVTTDLVREISCFFYASFQIEGTFCSIFSLIFLTVFIFAKGKSSITIFFTFPPFLFPSCNFPLECGDQRRNKGCRLSYFWNFTRQGFYRNLKNEIEFTFSWKLDTVYRCNGKLNFALCQIFVLFSRNCLMLKLMILCIGLL